MQAWEIKETKYKKYVTKLSSAVRDSVRTKTFCNAKNALFSTQECTIFVQVTIFTSSWKIASGMTYGEKVWLVFLHTYLLLLFLLFLVTRIEKLFDNFTTI